MQYGFITPPFCATVGLAEGEITSQNIVGYNTVTTEAAKTYPSLSACFVPVDGSTTIKLSDIKPTGMDSAIQNDMIITLNPATTEQNGQYLYFSKEEAESYGMPDEWVGWWKTAIGEESGGTKADDTEVSVGTAFLGNILSGASVSFQSSGEAPTETTKFVTTDGSTYPFFGNYLPKDLTLKDIVPVGMDSAIQNDMIITLNPETTEQNGQYLYFSKEEAESYGMPDSWVGWWKSAIGEESGGTKADDTSVPAGTAFLGNILSGNVIEFQFPSVLAE